MSLAAARISCGSGELAAFMSRVASGRGMCGYEDGRKRSVYAREVPVRPLEVFDDLADLAEDA
jgi:hypothetical protein